MASSGVLMTYKFDKGNIYPHVNCSLELWGVAQYDKYRAWIGVMFNMYIVLSLVVYCILFWY